MNRYYGYRLGLQGEKKNDQKVHKTSLDKIQVWEDPRVRLIKKKYIKKRTVLDIGCNAGYLTIAIASQLRPRMILGIDLDGILISKARKMLSFRANELSRKRSWQNDFTSSHLIERKTQEEKAAKVKPLETGLNEDKMRDDEFDFDSEEESPLISFSGYHFKEHSIYEDEGIVATDGGLNPMTSPSFSSFPYNVYFKTENFITDRHFAQQYDTITW